MSPRSPNQKIYHITHVNNLAGILAAGGLVSDAAISANGSATAGIGMSKIKQRRLTLPVRCHPGTSVGDYVPFYFCQRSVMLFVIHCANHPELTYRGGQGPIVHLEVDLNAVLVWAKSVGRRWAFSFSNAGAKYTSFSCQPMDLDQLDWRMIADNDFRSPAVREAKQAEFLVHGDFPWTLVSRIGVRSANVGTQVRSVLTQAQHRPQVAVEPSWYY